MAEKVSRTRADWAAATQTPAASFDFDYLDLAGNARPDGTVRLAATPLSQISSLTDKANITDLNELTPIPGIRWIILDDLLGETTRFRRFRAKLGRFATGAGQMFNGHFAMQMWGIRLVQLPNQTIWPIVTPLLDPAPFLAADDIAWVADQAIVDFDLAPYGFIFRSLDLMRDPQDPDQILTPVRAVFVAITAVPTDKAGNNAVGVENAAWRKDSTAANKQTYPSGITKVWHAALTTPSQAFGVQTDVHPITGEPLSAFTSETGMPWFDFETFQYPDPALGVSRLEPSADLGQAPQGKVELEFLHDVHGPGASSRAFISPNAGVNWFEFADGDLVGEDNSAAPPGRGGFDLSAVAVQQTYRFRWEVLASTDRNETPVLTRMGPRDRVANDVSELIEVASYSGFRVDPITLEPTVGEVEVFVARDGVRDFRDLATRIVTENEFADIEVVLYAGETDLRRRDWGLIDVLRVDDRRPMMEGEGFVAVSVMERMKGLIPPFDAQAGARLPKPYPLQSIQTILDDVVDNQITLAARYRGQLLPTTTSKATKTLKGSDGLEEAAALAFIDGYALVASQGRVKVVPMHLETSVAEAFTDDELEVLQFDPGFRRRLPEYFVRFGFDAKNDEFAGEVRAFNAAALAALGFARIDQEPTRPEETVEKWLAITHPADILGDGAGQVALQVWQVDDSVPSFVDETADFASAATGDVLPFPATEAVGDYFAVGQGAKFDRLNLIVATAGVGGVVAWEYWNGTAWAALTVTDESVGFTSAGTKKVTFTPPADWEPNTLNGVTKFYIRARVTTVYSTNPVLSRGGVSLGDQSFEANRVANRIPRFVGTGLIMANVRVQHAHPWLEHGDSIAFLQQTFVGRDPITGRKIAGPSWVIGVITAVHDAMGTTFEVWVRGYANILPGFVTGSRVSFGEPIAWVIEDSPAGAPENARFLFGAFPDDPVNVDIFYAYQALGTAVPKRTVDGSGWTAVPKLGAPAEGWDDVVLARDIANIKRLSVYALHRGVIGPMATLAVRQDKRAQVTTLSLSQVGTGAFAIDVDVSIVPDGDLRRWRVYRRVHATLWPTLDGTSTGAVGEGFFVAELDINPNSGGIKQGVSTSIPGGTSFSDNVNGSSGDVVRYIIIPRDANGNPGVRETGSITLAGSESPAFVTATRVLAREGTGCGAGNRKAVRVEWTTNGAVSDANQDVKVYEQVNGGGYTLIATVTDPKTTEFFTRETDYFLNASEPIIQIDYKLELITTAGPTVEDTEILGEDDLFNGEFCP